MAPAMTRVVWSSEDAQRASRHRIEVYSKRGYTVCGMITGYQQQRCSRFPEARLRVFQAGSGTQDLSKLGLR
eukprot:4136244-Pyramimonas_sp.AAC.1